MKKNFLKIKLLKVINLFKVLFNKIFKLSDKTSLVS